jgi:hypothetical protein
MLSLVPASRPTVSEVRSHPVFRELTQRTPPVLTVSDEGLDGGVIERLADLMLQNPGSLLSRLEELSINPEKVLYRLAARCEKFEGAEDPPEPSGFVSSLPQQTALSRDYPLLREDSIVEAIAAPRAAVSNAIVTHMLARRFLVSTTAGGSREFVLNQAHEDLCVDIRVCTGDDPGSSFVIMRGLDSATSDVRRFLDRRFCAVRAN